MARREFSAIVNISMRSMMAPDENADENAPVSSWPDTHMVYVSCRHRHEREPEST